MCDLFNLFTGHPTLSQLGYLFSRARDENGRQRRDETDVCCEQLLETEWATKQQIKTNNKSANLTRNGTVNKQESKWKRERESVKRATAKSCCLLFHNKSCNGLLSLLCLVSVLRLLSQLITAKSGFIAYTPELAARFDGDVRCSLLPSTKSHQRNQFSSVFFLSRFSLGSVASPAPSQVIHG